MTKPEALTCRSLEDLAQNRFVSFEYEYDFDNGWRHVTVIDDVGLAEPSVFYPRCLDGARSRPPFLRSYP